MKTYTIKAPLLKIQYEDMPQSPREWSNLGYFITVQRNKISPDGEENPEIQSIVFQTGNEAVSTEDHMKMIKKEIKEQTGEKVLAIYPVYCYEHGNIVYRIGTASGFDASNCGFYIITDRTKKVVGTTKKNFEKVIAQELETYTQWANGEVYSYVLYNDRGQIRDQCGGFYDIEDIKLYLPDEWKEENLQDYFVA